jgi:indolepyruvate ferredoxin oxidoreductase alpha subunit
MAERSFKKEVLKLRAGAGETFHGEGILAVTKGLLQSGVSYVGGYQGAPVSHLIDVLVDSSDLLDELGVHLETCTNEASAAAMLGASINYPVRGAVAWKSIVGTNVASDALSNLASAGVMGGALIVVGEDYGEGASVIQERTHAIALKSGIWLMDPRPELGHIVDMVETSFELSEATNTPVFMELRIRACHVTGEFKARDNREGVVSRKNRASGPPKFDYGRLAHPPATFNQEKLKVEVRRPEAERFIIDRKLNEDMGPSAGATGILVQGGLYNALMRAMHHHGLTDGSGQPIWPVKVLNVVHPLARDEIREFCTGKSHVLVVEEGNPEFIEEEINTILRRADIQTRLHGKEVFPVAGEYTIEVLTRGLQALRKRTGGMVPLVLEKRLDSLDAWRDGALDMLGGPVPERPPTFCTGCPERPVFTAIKLLERDIGKVHVAADIGCHALATFAPFSLGNSILGYGMSLASAAGVGPMSEKRPIAIMGDGGFWHNGLVTGVSSSLFNKGDGVLIIMQNGYTSATGIQWLPSSGETRHGTNLGGESHANIEKTLRSLGVRWLKRIRSYSVATMRDTLHEAMTTDKPGLKVVIADGECQLARQRRLRGETAKKRAEGKRMVRVRYGIDDETCTGDHSCIRLSGCPSLSIKPTRDPLRTDPVATVVDSCVGCGHCGEVAHAAVLCPSFYRTEIVENPNRWDEMRSRVSRRIISWLQSRHSDLRPAATTLEPAE